MLKETKRFAICLVIIAFLGVTLFGCASQTDFKALEDKVQQSLQQSDQALQDAQAEAVKSANSAVKAENAADRAEQAAQRAETAAQKAESIFMKHMKK